MSQKFEITSYKDEYGKDHFSEWISSRDWHLQNIIFGRLNRARLGNLGDHKSLGDGLYELRIHFGPGYRIYFSKEKKLSDFVALRRQQIFTKKRRSKSKKFSAEVL